MNYIDFFSGSGGLSIGLESVGFELVYANDLNKHATDTFKRNLTFIGSDKEKVINLPIELLHKQLINQKIKKDYQGKVHMNNRTKKFMIVIKTIVLKTSILISIKKKILEILT